MTPNSRTDNAILAWLGEGPTSLTAAERRTIADVAEVVAQRRPVFSRWLPSTHRFVALVAAVVALVLAVSALVYFGGPSPIPSVEPSPTPISSTGPSPSRAAVRPSCERDIPAQTVEWTGRVRTDLAGMPVVSSLTDPLDAGCEGIDILAIQVDQSNQPQYRIALDALPPAATTLDRNETVIEYGFVFETTGDGVPDYVVAINNDAPQGFRVWVTDLATNTTQEQVGPPYGYPVEFRHPDEGTPGMLFTFLQGEPWATNADHGLRFYAWSSVTSGGDVIAWDYAPDFGWAGDDGAGVPNAELEGAFDLPYPAAVWEQVAESSLVHAPETIGLPTADAPGLWAWTDDLAEAVIGPESRIDLVNIQFSRGCLVTQTLCVEFMPATPLSQHAPWASAAWLAYGLDVDADGDGDADYRFGMDNGSLNHRGWFVDLATGRITEAATIEPGVDIPGIGETQYPWTPKDGNPNLGHLWLQRQGTLWREGAAGFRLWSAVVRNGYLVAFDFAPNDGWLAIPPLEP